MRLAPLSIPSESQVSLNLGVHPVTWWFGSVVGAVCDDRFRNQGGFMQTVLVMKQLAAVLDHFLMHVSKRVRLTTQDALVLAWLVEREGMGATMIAARVGRTRQSVQRTLVRLEDRFMVARFESDSRERTEGWGLTEHGRETWSILEDGFGHQDAELERRGVNFREWLRALEELMQQTMAVRRSTFSLGLVDPPVDDMPTGRDH